MPDAETACHINAFDIYHNCSYNNALRLTAHKREGKFQFRLEHRLEQDTGCCLKPERSTTTFGRSLTVPGPKWPLLVCKPAWNLEHVQRVLKNVVPGIRRFFLAISFIES
jgi:hypothetical protein